MPGCLHVCFEIDLLHDSGDQLEPIDGLITNPLYTSTAASSPNVESFDSTVKACRAGANESKSSSFARKKLVRV